MAVTTGRFETREDLERAVFKQVGEGSSQTATARDCGVSASTVAFIIKKRIGQAAEPAACLSFVGAVTPATEPSAPTRKTCVQDAANEKPWEREGNFKKFWHAGMMCVIGRTYLGHLCAYVRVPRSHAGYRKGYNKSVWGHIHVHGGLTYADAALRRVTGGNLKGWWVGFDCAHAYDLSPRMMGKFPELLGYASYRDFAYVTAEVKSLAEQVAAHA